MHQMREMFAYTQTSFHVAKRNEIWLLDVVFLPVSKGIKVYGLIILLKDFKCMDVSFLTVCVLVCFGLCAYCRRCAKTIQN